MLIKKVSLNLLFLITVSSSALAQSQWELIWSDEFNYSGLPDNDKWYFEHGPDWPNGELQYYTLDRLENGRVENGSLIIEARHEEFGGRQYTSARLLSKTGFKYGRMEIRAKLTQGENLWPAIWMFPKKEIYGGWPSSGEIDIMEYWSWDPKAVFGTVHTDSYNHINHTEKQGRIELKDPSKEFHVFAIEWYEDQIRWLVDDVLFFTFYNEGDTASFPFDHPFHFILNVAVEAAAPGKENTWSKRTMEVDYVRVYEGPLSGPATVYHSISDVIEAENYFDAAGVRNQNNDTGINVGFIDPNDWMNYRVKVEGAQQYGSSYTVASPAGGSFELRSGDNVLETIDVPNTGGWQFWQEVGGSVRLPEGNQTLTLHSVSGGFNIDRMQFKDKNTPLGKQIPQSTKTTPFICKIFKVSSQEGENKAENICDKKAKTRWASDWNDNQWVVIDFLERREFTKIELHWEAAYAQQYELQILENGEFRTIFTEVNGNGGTDTVNLEGITTRYLLLKGIKRATSYGYSLFSIDGYGPQKR